MTNKIDDAVIVPEWARYMARDADGNLYAYEYEPEPVEEEGQWLDQFNGQVLPIAKLKPLEKWQESLVIL